MGRSKKQKVRIPELALALQRREYHVENRINYFRGIILIIFGIADYISLKTAGYSLTDEYLPWYAFAALLYGGYLLFIHAITRSEHYHEWLKYLVSAMDFAVYFSIFYFDTEIHRVFQDKAGIANFYILLVVLLVTVNSLRYGIMIIGYNMILGMGLSSLLSLSTGHTVNETVYFCIFIALSGFMTMWISHTFTHQYVDLQKRERLMRFFSRDVIESVDAGLININLGGVEREVTVMMADIRGFTELSEHESPARVVSLLNEYHSIMTDIIHSHGGIVDKFIGDAIMALFGVPVLHEDETAKAVQCAVAMIRQLPDLNMKLRDTGYPPIRIGIALHTGTVIAGNIGSETRMDYTVIGDAVNVASRIEGLNKKYKTTILISDSTNDRIQGKLETVFVDETIVRGRTAPVKLYTVVV